MITRFALFKGTFEPDDMAAFRAAVRERSFPFRTRTRRHSDVRAMFSNDRTEGVPAFALPLAGRFTDRVTKQHEFVA